MTTTGSVIIVGGGLAGISVARDLVKADSKGGIKITIVDRQNYLDWSLASPRMLAHPDDIEKFGYCMPLEAICKHVAGKHGNITFVQGAVSKIGATSVKLENGTTLEGDAIVIAVGGQYVNGAPWKPLPDQTTKECRIAGMRTLHEKLSQGKHICVVGAGPSGTEIAGELKAIFPDTKVTLVGSLLPHSTAAYQLRVKKALEKLGVVLQEGHLDDMEPDGSGNLKTREGEVIETVDSVLNAAGFVYKGKELADDSISMDVTKRGQFSCRPTLQLASIDTVFCCGDILEVPNGFFADVKGAQHADDTALVVAKNIVCLLQNKPLADFKWSKVAITKPIFTALGTKVGIADMGMPYFMENYLCRSLKCKDYYMSLKASVYGKGKTWK